MKAAIKPGNTGIITGHAETQALLRLHPRSLIHGSTVHIPGDSSLSLRVVDRPLTKTTCIKPAGDDQNGRQNEGLWK